MSETVTREDISFPLGSRIIKIGMLLDMDGCRVNIASKSNAGGTLIVALADSLIVNKNCYAYIKRLAGFANKSEGGKRFKVSAADKITADENLLLFDSLCEKYCGKPFDIFLGKIGLKIMKKREKFLDLEIEEQVSVLLQMVNLVKTGRVTGCDLKLIGESGQAGVLTRNSVLNKIRGTKEICIIDQSPTGLFEKRSVNLLEL